MDLTEEPILLQEHADRELPPSWLRKSLGWTDERLGVGGDRVWRSLKTRPMLGVVAASLTGLGLAMTVGASELIVAFAAGYAAYQVLLRDKPPSQAVEEVAKLGL